jgi:hypothetical protein
VTGQQLADALVAWAIDVIPELDASASRSSPENAWPLPDIAVSVVETTQDPGVAIGGGGTRLQQGATRVRRCAVLLAVEPGQSAEESDSASRMLYDFSDRLMDQLLTDETLGGHLPKPGRVRKHADCSFDPPFIEFDDGTRARIATVTVFAEDLRQ